jgi:hypothetical protein
VKPEVFFQIELTDLLICFSFIEKKKHYKRDRVSVGATQTARSCHMLFFLLNTVSQEPDQDFSAMKHDQFFPLEVLK